MPALVLLVTLAFFQNLPFGLFCGGDKRDRTADPLLAKQVLSQLSYTPISTLVH